MKTIGLIGFGDLGQQIEHLIKSVFNNVEVVYFDDKAFNVRLQHSYPFTHFLNSEFKDIEFYVGLGYKYPDLKMSIMKDLIKNGRKIGTYIHPTAFVDKTSMIDVGTIIYPNVTIDKNVQIGKGNIINLAAIIAHDSIISDCCFIAPGVSISGFVNIGRFVFIGTGTSIADHITINDHATIGIGSVITKKVERGQFVIGNPQKIVRSLKL